MKRVERNSTSDESAPSKSTGAAVCVLVLLVVVGITKEMGVISASFEHALSLLLMLIGVGWAVKGSEKLLRLSELYLWLAFILSLGLLQALAHRLAGLIGLDGLAVYRLVSIVHVIVIIAALWVLGAWSREEGQANANSYPARPAAGLLIVGAVVFWVGAATFPGTALEKILANPAAHFWTNITFLLAAFITLAGLALFTLALREAGDRFLSVLGLLAFMFGAVFWTIHLAFRLTVLVGAAQELNRTSMPPPWLQPWRDWAGLLFGIYSVLAYLGIAAYGGALLKTGLLARWVGWTCLVFGLLAAPFVGPPFIIHIMPWFVGILLVRQRSHNVEIGMTPKLISSGSTFERDIGYSRAVVNGEWVFVSGTTGFDYSTMSISESLVEQAEQCFRNIEMALQAAGSSLRDVVRVTYVLPNAASFPECWPVLRKYFGEIKPAAMMISAGLSDPRMLIEIEVTARRGAGD